MWRVLSAHPLYEDGEFSFRGLLDQLARGTGTIGVALPSLAAAVPAAVVGAKGSAGALVAGGLTSGLMNIGDIGLKAEDMDEVLYCLFCRHWHRSCAGCIRAFSGR